MKRRAAISVVEPELPKRQRINDVVPVLDGSTPPKSDDDVSDHAFLQSDCDFSDNEKARPVNTPITPSSPGRSRYPSQMKTIACPREGCDKTFNRPARLATHLLKHEGKKTFMCTYEGCDKAYFEQKHLTSHVKGSHVQERSYACDWEDCKKCFLTATRLKRHKEAHAGHERFRCTAFPPCTQTFRKHQTLQRHIRADHLNESPFPCTYVNPITNEQCDSGFDAASKLKRHKDQVHGNILKFICEECSSESDIHGHPVPVAFGTKAKLQAHLKSSHANCHFCEYKFSSQRELQKHIETLHSGTSLEERKNIACTYLDCDKKFTKQSNLNAHIKTAHKGQRFICGEVDLSQNMDLVGFMNVNGCGKDFVAKSNLEDHVRTAHLGMPSLINRNRKSGDEESCQAGKQKREKLSVIDEILGTKYDERRSIPCIISTCAHKFMRDYDLQIHVRSKHRLSTPEVEELELALNLNQALAAEVKQEDQVPGFDDGVELDALYGTTDLDWEMQRRALEGTPFWVGAEEGVEEDELLGGEWMQDEIEMRKLIDQEMAIDPDLELPYDGSAF
ncbi:zinc finger protein [Phlyctema vagabunda]|uniref:Zinc finger protein n=1 Tax=Phlyctema vagabunda TaxID=108571 RepID=A0ABR4PXW3_9HELO